MDGVDDSLGDRIFLHTRIARGVDFLEQCHLPEVTHPRQLRFEAVRRMSRKRDETTSLSGSAAAGLTVSLHTLLQFAIADLKSDS
jgi:hypothetical protein